MLETQNYKIMQSRFCITYYVLNEKLNTNEKCLSNITEVYGTVLYTLLMIIIRASFLYTGMGGLAILAPLGAAHVPKYFKFVLIHKMRINLNQWRIFPIVLPAPAPSFKVKNFQNDPYL